MATWVVKDNKLGIPAIDEVQDSMPTGVSLGEAVQAKHNTYGAGEFLFLKGAASVAVGEWVVYNRLDGTVTRAVANVKGPLAIAMAATVADTFGFYARKGVIPGKVLASFADNGDVYLTSTDGSVDDAVVAGDYVFGAKGASAIGTPSAGLALIEIDNPFVKDGLDDAT